jgi:hypothetical protein
MHRVKDENGSQVSLVNTITRICLLGYPPSHKTRIHKVEIEHGQILRKQLRESFPHVGQ